MRLLGSGTVLREVEAAAEMLAERGVTAEIYSATSYNELARDLRDTERWNLLHPEEEPRVSHVSRVPRRRRSRWFPRATTRNHWPSRSGAAFQRPLTVLGTDGFGRSDTREQLRNFFEVDRALHYTGGAVDPG